MGSEFTPKSIRKDRNTVSIKKKKHSLSGKLTDISTFLTTQLDQNDAYSIHIM